MRPSARTAVLALIPVITLLLNAASGAADGPLDSFPWGHGEIEGDTILQLHVDTIPENRTLLIPRLNNRLHSLTVKDADTPVDLKFRPLIDQWQISLPESLTEQKPVILLETYETLDVPTEPRTVEQSESGIIELPAHKAVTHGRLLRFEPQPFKNTVGYWADANDWVEWHLNVRRPGEFDVYVLQGCGTGQGGSVIEISVGNAKTELTIEDTGHFQNFKRRTAGKLRIAAGKHELQIRPISKAKNAVGDIRAVCLVPAGTEFPSNPLTYLASANESRIDIYSIGNGGELTLNTHVDLPGNCGPLAISPDGTRVYAAMNTRQKGKPAVAEVATLHRSDDGSLRFLGKAGMSGRSPYLKVDNTGNVLLSSHYGEGEVTSWEIKDGSYTGKQLDRHTTAPRAHSVELDPSGKFAYVPHTSPNAVFQFRLDPQTGKLTPLNPPSVAGPDADHNYHEPRHYAHHPSLDMAYTSNERGGGISAWEFDSTTGQLKLVQTLSTLPPDFTGNSAAADIHITPDGRFVYVSNRDVGKYENPADARDTLAGFAIDSQTGRLELIGYFPTISFPRSFCIDPSGRFVYAAGQRSNNLAAYRIDAKTGALNRIATYDCGAGPIWVMCTDD